MECRKNELPGASRKTVRQRRKNAADKTLGNRALSVAAGSRSVPAGAYPRIRGEPFRLWMAPTAYRGLAALLRTATPGVFSEEGTIQRNTRRTASPPSKMIAEGKRGRRFYERLPRTVLNLLQYADGLKDGGGGFNALCFRPWCPRVRWPARCCPWSTGRSPPARRFRETHGQGPWWLRPPRNQNEASRPG